MGLTLADFDPLSEAYLADPYPFLTAAREAAPKRVAEMEDFVRDLVTRFCTERLRDGHADMVRDLAWELPVLVLFRILGLSDDEVPRVKAGSWNRILFVYGHPTDDVQRQAAEGMAVFWRYAEGLVESRRIRRANADEHLSFGTGPHFCPGAPPGPSTRRRGTTPVRTEHLVPGSIVVAGRVGRVRRGRV